MQTVHNRQCLIFGVFVCSQVELASDELTEEEQFSMMADLEEMDLLGEIFDTLNTQSSTEPGLLYSTRSLDVFTSDCTDFISRVSTCIRSIFSEKHLFFLSIYPLFKRNPTHGNNRHYLISHLMCSRGA